MKIMVNAMLHNCSHDNVQMISIGFWLKKERKETVFINIKVWLYILIYGRYKYISKCINNILDNYDWKKKL